MSTTEKQPVSSVVWVDRESIRPNDYNPNRQYTPEHKLLKKSIMEDGWTQPIVVFKETMTIVDGEHRWQASADKKLLAMTGGKVPVVFIDKPLDQRMVSTIRHNRARGQHIVGDMCKIVCQLLADGWTAKDVMSHLQMELEEVERLAEQGGMPEVVGKNHEFAKGWIP